MGEANGEGRPLLLVLSVDSGLDFPSASQGSVLKVKARLDEAWLESGDVVASSNPQFGTELAWEVAEEQLKELKRQRAAVRLEVWRNSNEMLGHQMMDVRTAVALVETDTPTTSLHKLKGCSTPNLRIGLGLAVLPGEVRLATPQLIEGDEGGYFILKPGEEGDTRSTLSVTIHAASSLDALHPPGTSFAPSDSLYFHYSLLGVDVSTEPFHSLVQPSFPPETATARLRASTSTLNSFLSSSQLSVHLCQGSSILATAQLPLSTLCPNPMGEATYEGVLPLIPVSSQVLPTTANLTLSIMLRPDLPPIASSAPAPSISMPLPSPPTRLAREEVQQPVVESAQMDRGANFDRPNASKSLDFSADPASPFGHPSPVDLETPLADVTQQTDCTLYQSPPPAKHPRLVPTSLFQPPQSSTTSPPTRAYRLSLELTDLTLSAGSEEVVLAYKYTALHPSAISTAPAFPVPAGQKTSVPRGYCEFSFAVQEQRMVETFRRHPLRVVVKGSGSEGRLGVASLNLSSVLQNGQVAAEQHFEGRAELRDESKHVVGSIAYQITLSREELQGQSLKNREEGNLQRLPSATTSLQGGAELTDAMARTRMEVEMWKEEEMRRFKRSLAEVESEHLQLLGREWKEREVERESSLQESWQKIRKLEQELREEIDGVRKERGNLEESKKALEVEKGEVLKVRQEVNGGKSNLISKLKSKIKELEGEFETKVLEVDSLKKHLESTKKELEKKENAKSEKKSREEGLLSEVMQLRAEKNTWESKAEHCQKERDFFATNCEMLNKEVVELRREKEEAYTGQIARLEERVRELSCQLESKTAPPPSPSPSPSPVPPSEQEQSSNSRRMEEERGELEGRITRLQENYDMLLRTGVYTTDDPVVIYACKMAGMQTPRTLGRPENISNVLDCFTEASMIGKSYCREKTRNQSRFISFVPDMVAEVEEQEESLEAVVGAQWQVHRVSPLWGVPYKGAGTSGDKEEGMGTCPNVRRLVVGVEQNQEDVYDEKGLSRQARSIAEVVGSHAEVTITPLMGLRGSRFDREALSILVSQKMSGKQVETFQGILCSVEAEEVVMSQSRKVTNLPVLLTRGTVEVTEKVVLGMERCWDCVIGKLQLPPRELQWMVAMWAGLGPCPRPVLGDLTNTREEGEGTSKQLGSVKLVYGLPDSLAQYREQINRFTFELGAREIREIWKCCREEGGNCLSQGEMEAFHNSIALHIRSTLGICTEKLELVQIQLPFLRAHSGGRLAIGAVDRVKTVLRLLTELCQPLLEVNPTLAIGTGEEPDTISMDYTVTREAN